MSSSTSQSYREHGLVILSSMDGAYYLVGPDPDAPAPQVARGATGVSLTAARDFVLVTTMASWEDIRVDVTLLPMPFVQSGPLGWEVDVSAEIEMTGPARVTDMEHDPGDGPEVALSAGRYLVQLRARSSDFVRDNPQLQIDGAPMEQHMMFLSPLT